MYSEEEIFRMTPRKFFLVYDEYLSAHGYKKDTYAIDDMWGAF